MAPKTKPKENRWFQALPILVVGALFALLLWRLGNWQAGALVFFVAQTLGAYVYGKWERAWAPGLVSAIGLAFIIGGGFSAPTPFRAD